jgi:Protein of unknown function DUF2620
MKKVVIGGQLDKESIAQKVLELGAGALSVEIKGDIEAAMAVQSGAAHYYIGACNTGAGGALAMAIALVGAQHCVSISLPGNIKSSSEIEACVAEGKKAFGFVAEHTDQVLPTLIATLIK